MQTDLMAGDVEQARERLLDVAVQSVSSDDQKTLGQALSLLGELALGEQDFDTAQVYLHEALDVYQFLGDSIGEAGIPLQLGKMHLILRERERAQVAGHAYDRMLLAAGN
jgi:uncharacterized protein HemY